MIDLRFHARTIPLTHLRHVLPQRGKHRQGPVLWALE
jgi:hypothetical protein